MNRYTNANAYRYKFHVPNHARTGKSDYRQSCEKMCSIRIKECTTNGQVTFWPTCPITFNSQVLPDVEHVAPLRHLHHLHPLVEPSWACHLLALHERLPDLSDLRKRRYRRLGMGKGGGGNSISIQ